MSFTFITTCSQSWTRFGTQIGANLELEIGAKSVQKPLLKVITTLQAKRQPKLPQTVAKTCRKTIFFAVSRSRILLYPTVGVQAVPTSILEPFWHRFGVVLEPFWDHVWNIFGEFWYIFQAHEKRDVQKRIHTHIKTYVHMFIFTYI